MLACGHKLPRLMSITFRLARAILLVCAVKRVAGETSSSDQLCKDNVLLQARAVNQKRTVLQEHATWVAGPFGDCVERCGVGHRTREVQCRSLWGASASDLTCAGLHKPPLEELCDCSVTTCKTSKVCVAGDTDSLMVVDSAEKSPSVDSDSSPPFKELGCLVGASSDSEKALDLNSVDLYDESCMRWDKAGPCHGGFPFYRMVANGMSPTLCFAFCASKGLDFFSMSASGVCRCGASAINEGVWHHREPKEHLRLASDKIIQEKAEEACDVRVFRYTGHLDDGSMPIEMIDGTIQDEAYIDSIVSGHKIASEAEEHDPSLEAHANDRGIRGRHKIALTSRTQDGDQPAWNRPCFPHACGPGGGPWKKRRKTLMMGLQGRWQDYAIVEFYFDPTLSASRKAAFRKAIEVWSSHTCIRFVEAAVEPPPPSLLVDALDPDACYATHIGFPGDDAQAAINLGWCDSSRFVGNIIHELGHVLGMNHEQKRPDAVHAYHGHGPHLKVHWENVEDVWIDQYTQDTSSYIGSTHDGHDDPHVGYAEYDFGSIMHYPVSDHFETLPKDKGSLTGNRKTLTPMDIKQILDIYQCKKRR